MGRTAGVDGCQNVGWIAGVDECQNEGSEGGNEDI